MAIKEIGAALDRVARNTINDNFKSQDGRIDNLVLQAGDAHPELQDAHYSGVKGQTFATVGKRFDAVEQQAIADKSTANSELQAGLATKRDKSVMLTQADMSTSSEAHKLTMNHLSQEVKNAMSGTAPVSPNIADGQVTNEKLSNDSITYEKFSADLKNSLGGIGNVVLSNIGIGPGGNDSGASNTRVSTGVLNFEKGTILSVPDDIDVLCYYFNNADVFVSESGWVKKAYVAGRVRLQFKKTSGANISPTEVYSKVKKNVEKDMLNYLNILLERKSYSAGAEVGTSTTRVYSDILTLDEGTIISSYPGYNVLSYEYDEVGAYIAGSDTGWQKSVVVGKNKIRLGFKKESGTTIVPNEVYGNTMFSQPIVPAVLKTADKRYYELLKLSPLAMIGYSLGVVTGATSRRISTDNIIVFSKETFIGAGEDLVVIGYFYDNEGNFISETGFSESIVVKGNVRLQFKNKDNASFVSIADVYENVTIIYGFSTQTLPSTKLEFKGIVSDIENEKMCHVPSLYEDKFSNDGTFWGAYYTNKNAETENPNNLNIFVKLFKFNIARPEKVEYFDIIHVGDSFGDFTQGNRAPYDPNILVLSDKVIVYFNAYTSNTNVEKRIFIGTLEFDKTTKVVSNFKEAKIKVGSDNVKLDYEGMRLAYNEYSGENLSATTKTGDIAFSSEFILKDGYYWQTINEIFTANNLKGALIRSEDGINWEVYATPKNVVVGSAVETAIAFVGEDLFWASRYRDGVRISKMNMTTKVFAEFVSIDLSGDSKPLLNFVNGKLILGYNSSQKIVNDWGTIERSIFNFVEVKLSDLETLHLYAHSEGYGAHYPMSQNFKGELLIVFSEDRRKIHNTQVRSNIGLYALKL